MSDAADALAWYGLRSDRAAAAFLAELGRAIDPIAEAPGRWPKQDDVCRRRAM